MTRRCARQKKYPDAPGLCCLWEMILVVNRHEPGGGRERWARFLWPSVRQALADARRRWRVGESLYNPANAFNEELFDSVMQDPVTGETYVSETSHLGKMEDVDYAMLLRSVENLASYWHGEEISNVREMSTLLGSLVLKGELAEDYLRAKEYLRKLENSAKKLPVEADGPECEDLLDGLRQLFAPPPLHNPLFGDVPEDKLDDAEFVSRKYWQHRSCCKREELLGRLLLEDDFGRADLRLIKPLADLMHPRPTMTDGDYEDLI